MKDARVKDALEGGTHGGVLVLADTKHQVINKACKGEICGVYIVANGISYVCIPINTDVSFTYPN